MHSSERYQKILAKTGVSKVNLMNELNGVSMLQRGWYSLTTPSVVIAMDIDHMKHIYLDLNKDRKKCDDIIVLLFDILTDCVNKARNDIINSSDDNNIIWGDESDKADVLTNYDLCVIHRSGDEFVIKAPTMSIAYLLCRYIQNEIDKNEKLQSQIPDDKFKLTMTYGIGGSLKNADETLVSAKTANKRNEIVADSLSSTISFFWSITGFYYRKFLLQTTHCQSFVVLDNNKNGSDDHDDDDHDEQSSKKIGIKQCEDILKVNKKSKQFIRFFGYGIIIFVIPFIIMILFWVGFEAVQENETNHTALEFGYLGYFIGLLISIRSASKRWDNIQKNERIWQSQTKMMKNEGVYEKEPELLNFILFPAMSPLVEWRFDNS